MNTSERIIRDITDFIFVEDRLERADLIIIPGSSWPELSERAAELYHGGWAALILPTGKYGYQSGCFRGLKSKSDVYSGDYCTEWEFERHVLIKNGVPEEAILREDQSTHTVENAFCARRAADECGLTVKRAILCCKAFHARRCLMTFGWAFPETEFLLCPTVLEGVGRDTWHLTAYGRERVLGEVSKCGSYFQDVAELFAENSPLSPAGGIPPL